MYPSSFNEVYGIFVHEQVKALKDKGIEIKVISPVPKTPFPINTIKGKWKKISMIPEYKDWGKIPVWYPRYTTFPKSILFESSGERMYRGIRQLTGKIYQDCKFDLIHAHVALPDGYAAMKLSEDFNVPYVVTIHGQDFYITIHKNNKCKNYIKKILQKAEKIIVVSNELKKIAINNFGDNKNIRVIGNGIPINKIINMNNLDHKSKIKKKILLSVSYLIKRKGIEYNLRAFSRLTEKYPNFKYQIIGDGIERNILEDLSKELKITDKVEFLGMLTHDKVFKKMLEADIFSLPSWNEAFGVVYIEAMACGKPVIGCKGEGIEDFVENGKTGMLVKPKDVDSLAKAMSYLLSNPDKAREMGEKAQKLVLENYTWEKNAEETIKVYQEVINNAR
jgi:teichuronic acid biosynthesis glycosyltransferase TuaC